tara:strand:+ start:90 stop:929 length:840 start_codon:yes stop_codon:yes gene_type:complete
MGDYMADTSPDIQASLENADEIAKLTGRSKGDVIADLLDDGKLNNSNAIKENTSALDKATEMAGKTHKLLTALIPILILVAGSGLELGGIINLTPAGSEEPFWEDEEYEVYWGCTDWDAINYDDYANEDDGSCYYEEEVWGCTNDAASNYDENATNDDGSCIPADEEPTQNCTGSFYNPEVKLETVNNTTDMKIYWDADWSCEVEQYVEIDIAIKWTENQSYYYSNFAGYNITGNTGDVKVFTKTNIPSGNYDVCLSFWVDIDGWRMDSEWNETNITIV